LMVLKQLSHRRHLPFHQVEVAMHESMFEAVKLLFVLVAIDHLALEQAGSYCNASVEVAKLVTDLSH
jgi:hypothetical protein